MDPELLGCIEEEEETGTDFITKDIFIVVYCCKCKTYAFRAYLWAFLGSLLGPVPLRYYSSPSCFE